MYPSELNITTISGSLPMKLGYFRLSKDEDSSQYDDIAYIIIEIFLQKIYG